MPRRFPIFQFPNRPLIATMLAAALAELTEGSMSRAAKQLSRLALLVWSTEEIATGANWFRRVLGLTGAAFVLRALGRSGAR